MSYLVIFFTSLLLTIFFTPYLINFLTKVRIVDAPDEQRKLHKIITPRMGGIIIYFTAMVSVISFYRDLNAVRFFVIASLIIVSLGIVDDIIGVYWDKKFLFQTIAAIFLIYFLTPFFNTVQFFGFHIPYPFDYFLLFILIIGCINSVNLMDGLDGLVSGFSLLVVSVTFIVGYYYSNIFLMILSISLMGSLIGFLKFNAYPARIFLGDTGSQSLGFFIITAGLLASLNINKTSIDLTFPVILLGVPIIDTLKVIVVRSIHKKNIFMADRSHIHHILFGMKIRHKVTVFILQGFSFLYAIIAIYYIRGSKAGAVILFVLITIPFLFIKNILIYAQQKIHPTFFGDLYNKIPEVFVTLFIKIILPLFSLFLLIILFGLIPVKSSINNYLIALSIAFVMLMLIYSIINYQRNKQTSDILVFINMIIFLLFSNNSEPIYKTLNMALFITPNQLLIFIVFPVIVFFFFFREKILKKKESFLTGMDLIILIFIVLLTISSNLLPNHQIIDINSIAFNSFLLYIFYKVIVTVKTRFQIPVFYSSFIIPIIILTVLLFN